MERLINLTPHTVTVQLGEKVVEFPPSGQIARVGVEYTPTDEVGGIPVVRATTGAVEGLPDPAEGVYYIVSAMVAQALPQRHDLLAPDTGAGAVRDETGRIIAVTRFVRYDTPAPSAPTSSSTPKTPTLTDAHTARLQEMKADAPIQERLQIALLLSGGIPYITRFGNLEVAGDPSRIRPGGKPISMDEAIRRLEERLAADGLAVHRAQARTNTLLFFEKAVIAEMEGRKGDACDAIYEMLEHVWGWGVRTDDWLRNFRRQFFREEGSAWVSWPTFLNEDD